MSKQPYPRQAATCVGYLSFEAAGWDSNGERQSGPSDDRSMLKRSPGSWTVRLLVINPQQKRAASHNWLWRCFAGSVNCTR